MLDDITRLSPKYTGVGTTTFAFSFRIFALTDIYVKLAASSTAGTSTTLTKDTDYTVTANLNTQETTPGGSITLIGDYAGGLTSGQVLVIGSNVPYTQTTQLTNFSKFPPEILNTALDRVVAEVQQIKERQSRTVTVDETDSRSPNTVINELLTARDTAVTKAAEASNSATSAASSASSASASVNGFDTHVAAMQTVFDNNASSKTSAFDANASDKTTAFNNNATAKTTAFDSNASDKTTAYNTNDTNKTNAFNLNAASKQALVNEGALTATQKATEATNAASTATEKATVATSSATSANTSKEACERIQREIASGLQFKGVVATESDLPATATIGDQYYVSNSVVYKTWSGTAWVTVGASQTLVQYDSSTKETIFVSNNVTYESSTKETVIS